MDAPSAPKTTDREMEIGICTQCIISILIPIKLNTKAKPYLRKIKRSAKSASKKYMARRPKMAKMLEVRTMKGSVVTAKIAGMLSTAKMTSLNSIIINTSKSGVAMRLPFSMVKNFSPSNCWLVGMTFLSRVRILFWERSSSASASGFII